MRPVSTIGIGARWFPRVRALSCLDQHPQPAHHVVLKLEAHAQRIIRPERVRRGPARSSFAEASGAVIRASRIQPGRVKLIVRIPAFLTTKSKRTVSSTVVSVTRTLVIVEHTICGSRVTSVRVPLYDPVTRGARTKRACPRCWMESQ